MEMRARLLLNIGLVLECQHDIQKAIENIQNVCQVFTLIEPKESEEHKSYQEINGVCVSIQSVPEVCTEIWRVNTIAQNNSNRLYKLESGNASVTN
jgi:hypothetical protein